MRIIIALVCYTFAILLIYTAFQIAPDMIWPHTSTEWLATQALVLGLITKFAGHIVLLSSSKRISA